MSPLLECKSKAHAVFVKPLDVAIGDVDRGVYVIDATWNVRKILTSGAVIVIALAGYVDAEIVPLVRASCFLLYPAYG